MRHDDRLAPLRRRALEAPILDVATERELIAEIARSGSGRALDRLVASHLRLVLSIARRYAGRAASMEDLVSEGHIGLLEAAKRFEPDRGTRFATYAAFWVRAYVRRFALLNRRIVGAPSTRSARRVLASLRETERQIAQREGRTATREEVASELSVTEADVAMVEAALAARDVAVGPSDERSSFDLVDQGPSPEQLAAQNELATMQRAQVESALEALSAREQRIVRERFLHEDGPTLAFLGRELGLSRERVRQIEKRAHQKLRTALTECVA